MKDLELQIAIIVANSPTAAFVIEETLVADKLVRAMIEMAVDWPGLASAVTSFPDLAACLNSAGYIRAEPALLEFIEWCAAAPPSFRRRLRSSRELAEALQLEGPRQRAWERHLARASG